jgi:outer membrane protein assembly factor BamB
MNGAGTIFALSPEGQLKWKKPQGRANDTYMVASVDGQIIYAPGRDSTLIALDAQSGSIRWSVNTHTQEYPKIAVDNQNQIYFYGYEPNQYGYIYSISPTGEVRWRYQLKYHYNGPCNGITLDYYGYIYFCFRTTGIIALDYSGKVRWIRTYGENFADVPIICDATNNLYALNISEPLIWCYDFLGNLKYSQVIPLSGIYALRQGAIGADGTLYLMSSSRWLIAIN